MSAITHDGMREAIFARIKDELIPRLAALQLPTEFENLKFEQPETGPWTRVELVCGDTAPGALGPKLNRTPFVLYCMVFMREKAGTKPAWQAADAMALSFDYAQIRPDATGNIAFQTTSPPKTVPNAQGFQQMNVTIVGYYDIRSLSAAMTDLDGAELTDTDQAVLT